MFFVLKIFFQRLKFILLIIPKSEYTDIYDFSKNASSEEKANIFVAFDNLIELFKLDKKGCRIITNFIISWKAGSRTSSFSFSSRARLSIKYFDSKKIFFFDAFPKLFCNIIFIKMIYFSNASMVR